MNDTLGRPSVFTVVWLRTCGEGSFRQSEKERKQPCCRQFMGCSFWVYDITLSYITAKSHWNNMILWKKAVLFICLFRTYHKIHVQTSLEPLDTDILKTKLYLMYNYLSFKRYSREGHCQNTRDDSIQQALK